MAICHGQGGPDQVDGCCYVNGAPCPLRWKIDGQQVYEGPDMVPLGNVEQAVSTYVNGTPKRNRGVEQLQNVVYACRAAVIAIAEDGNRVTDRAAFEAAWTAYDGYQPVADHWQSIGRPREWCPQYGPPEGQCCFSEDEATNQAKAGALHVNAVEVRSRRPG